MNRIRSPFGVLSPALFLFTLIIFILTSIYAGEAVARDRRGSGGGKGSAQKIPDKGREPVTRPSPPPPAVRKDPAPSRPPKRGTPSSGRRKDPVRPDEGRNGGMRPGGKVRPGGTRPGGKVRPPESRRDQVVRPPEDPGRGEGKKFKRKPPRKHRKRHPLELKKKKKRGPPPRIPPCIHPDPPVHIHHDWYFETIIHETYIIEQIYRPGPVDDEVYGIWLPFGTILPWEFDEMYLIKLKELEEQGMGGSMMTTIVQTSGEMEWEDFLSIYGEGFAGAVCYGPVGRTAFLVSMTVSDILDLMPMYGIRWIGEYYPACKIVPGAKGTRFYVRSLEGDSCTFRRELKEAGAEIAGFDPGTQEYCVHGGEYTYEPVASLWWVARVSSIAGEPFFYRDTDSELADAGMTRRHFRHP